jgi:hypothetical protein
MDFLKKILIFVIAAAILAGIFAIGAVFFIIALILLPIVYFYQKYKMDNLWGKVATAKKAQAEQDAKIIVNDEDVTIIEAEYSEIKEEEPK